MLGSSTADIIPVNPTRDFKHRYLDGNDDDRREDSFASFQPKFRFVTQTQRLKLYFRVLYVFTEATD